MIDKTPVKKTLQESMLIINFRSGDLLFGLHKEGRERFMVELSEPSNDKRARPKYLTIDEINKVLSPVYIFNASLKDNEKVPEEYGAEVSAHLAAWKNYPKYFPANIIGDQDLREKKIFIGSCKVALLAHPNTIHFCLDGLDQDAIRNRSNPYYPQYTSAELRCCAKNWSRVKERVKFYIDGEICEPPWGKQAALLWLTDDVNALKKMLPSTSINSDTIGGVESELTHASPILPRLPRRLAFSESDFEDDNSKFTPVKDAYDSPSENSSPAHSPLFSVARLVNTQPKKLNFEEEIRGGEDPTKSVGLFPE